MYCDTDMERNKKLYEEKNFLLLVIWKQILVRKAAYQLS